MGIENQLKYCVQQLLQRIWAIGLIKVGFVFGMFYFVYSLSLGWQIRK
jgi:hypothetical protein